MRYMLIHTADPDVAAEWDESENWASFSSWLEETVRSGVNLQGSRLRPTADATTVRTTDGKPQVLDGPYADSKEQLGGYFLIDVPDLDAAISWAARCPAAGHGAVEVRPIWVMQP